VLAFAPHPDDESIGCGGTLALLAPRCPVKVVLITDGSGAGALPPGTAEKRQAEFANALAALGVGEQACLNEPDGEFSDTPAFRDKVKALLEDERPNWVFLPSPLDCHRDHVRAAVVLTELCRQARSVEQLLYYEVWSPVPATHVVDITSVVEKKRAALQSHITSLAHRDYLNVSLGMSQYRSLYLPPAAAPRWAEAFWVEATDEQKNLFGQILNLGLSLIERLRSRN
jgi:LmbE family N-acetylglucosaminyl deacetylase